MTEGLTGVRIKEITQSLRETNLEQCRKIRDYCDSLIMASIRDENV